ncbi:SLC13 family permease [Oceanithermus sp.]|uniref:SLC13 family permease n=1 Tax=Oceanithermus sp. TaxID=2268145 RepID=UPI00257BE215|nr:SLC13 family permease [Oceanithermus sp.]
MQAWLKREALLSTAVLGLVASSLLLGRLPRYDVSDVEVLLVLYALLVLAKGLERHGAVRALASRLERGRWPGLRLVGLTFFLSMFVTNDVALLAVLPVSLRLHGAALETLAVLEVLAANAGSALSPVGNPQNLFLYWFYGVPLGRFVGAIAPFSLFFLPLLASLAWLWDRRHPVRPAAPATAPGRGAAVYLVFLVLFVPVVLRWVPAWLALLVPLAVARFDRATLRVDYALLATFAAFFGFTDNLRAALALAPLHPHHVFLGAALLSQLISNVPAALLLADFTRDWPALLWGVSVGGFGTLLASLANLIGYRLVRQGLPERAPAFLLRLHLLGFVFWLLGVGLYRIAGPG